MMIRGGMEPSSPNKPTSPESLNPYAPPKAVLTEGVPIVLDLNRHGPARLSKRFANHLIDSVGHYFLGAVVTASLAYLRDAGWSVGSFLEQLGFLGNLVFGICIAAGYYIYFETLFSITPGKWITGTRVVTTAGTKPSFGVIFKRTLCRMVPFEAFSFLGESSQGWHDRWSGTLVVDIRNPVTDKLLPSIQKLYR
jgi:uncharacterized RDD family membrane protein YckC